MSIIIKISLLVGKISRAVEYYFILRARARGVANATRWRFARPDCPLPWPLMKTGIFETKGLEAVSMLEGTVPMRKVKMGRGQELAAPYLERCFKMLAEMAFGVEGQDLVNRVLCKDADRIAAAKLLLEYGASKAPIRSEHTGEDGEPIAFTVSFK